MAHVSAAHAAMAQRINAGQAILAPTRRVVAKKDVYHVISVGRPCTLKGVLGAIGAHARGAGRAAADGLQHAVHVLRTAPALVR